MNLMKITNFGSVKHPVKRMKRHGIEWVKIFSESISDSTFVSRI